MFFRATILILLFSLNALAQEAPQVIVYGVDGLNTYRFEDALTPHIEYLKAHGSWTFHAKPNDPLSSSPNWKSIISGTTPDQHRVLENGFKNSVYKDDPSCEGEPDVFPTIFTMAKRHNPKWKVGYFEHWGAFRKLVRGDKINRHFWWEFAPGPVVNRALVFYKRKAPVITLIHVDQCDHAGHKYSHESEEYAESVEQADELLGKVLRTIDEKDGFSNTYLILVSDHGGKGHGHGSGTPEGMNVPWMVIGPGIKKGHEIQGEVKVEDTAPTIMRMLGIEGHECWTAKTIDEIFE